jgi:hypothetical protein
MARWRLQRLAVDAAVAKVPLLPMEIVKRSDDMKGFVILPRRQVVTAPLAETLATFATLPSVQLVLGRLARE